MLFVILCLFPFYIYAGFEDYDWFNIRQKSSSVVNGFADRINGGVDNLVKVLSGMGHRFDREFGPAVDAFSYSMSQFQELFGEESPAWRKTMGDGFGRLSTDVHFVAGILSQISEDLSGDLSFVMKDVTDAMRNIVLEDVGKNTVLSLMQGLSNATKILESIASKTVLPEMKKTSLIFADRLDKVRQDLNQSVFDSAEQIAHLLTKLGHDLLDTFWDHDMVTTIKKEWDNGLEIMDEYLRLAWVVTRLVHFLIVVLCLVVLLLPLVLYVLPSGTLQKVLVSIIVSMVVIVVVFSFTPYFWNETRKVTVCPRAHKLAFTMENSTEIHVVPFVEAFLPPSNVKNVFSMCEWGQYECGKSTTLTSIVLALIPKSMRKTCSSRLFPARHETEYSERGFTNGVWGVTIPLNLVLEALEKKDLSSDVAKSVQHMATYGEKGMGGKDVALFFMDSEGTQAADRPSSAMRTQNVLASILSSHTVFATKGDRINRPQINEVMTNMRLVEYATQQRDSRRVCMESVAEYCWNRDRDVCEKFEEETKTRGYTFSFRHRMDTCKSIKLLPGVRIKGGDFHKCEIESFNRTNTSLLYIPYNAASVVHASSKAEVKLLKEVSKVSGLVQPKALDWEVEGLHEPQNTPNGVLEKLNYLLSKKSSEQARRELRSGEFGVAFSIFHEYLPFIMDKMKDKPNNMWRHFRLVVDTLNEFDVEYESGDMTTLEHFLLKRVERVMGKWVIKETDVNDPESIVFATPFDFRNPLDESRDCGKKAEKSKLCNDAALLEELDRRIKNIKEQICMFRQKLDPVHHSILETNLTRAINDVRTAALALQHERCGYVYDPKGWRACEGECPGIKSREVTCEPKWLESDVDTVPNRCCELLGLPKLAETEKCDIWPPDLHDWDYDVPFGECSSDLCGKWTRTVPCECNGVKSLDKLCAGKKRPAEEQECNVKFKWEMKPWNPSDHKCDCKGGKQTRQVQCIRCPGVAPEKVGPEVCLDHKNVVLNGNKKPRTSKKCTEGPKWVHDGHGRCPGPCGCAPRKWKCVDCLGNDIARSRCSILGSPPKERGKRCGHKYHWRPLQDSNSKRHCGFAGLPSFACVSTCNGGASPGKCKNIKKPAHCDVDTYRAEGTCENCHCHGGSWCNNWCPNTWGGPGHGKKNQMVSHHNPSAETWKASPFSSARQCRWKITCKCHQLIWGHVTKANPINQRPDCWR